MISNGEFLVTLAGKKRTIRLQSLKSLLEHPLSTLDSKIIETKNATTFAVHSTSLILCVAIKNRILVYQLFSTPRPYHYSYIRELNTSTHESWTLKREVLSHETSFQNQIK